MLDEGNVGSKNVSKSRFKWLINDIFTSTVVEFTALCHVGWDSGKSIKCIVTRSECSPSRLPQNRQTPEKTLLACRKGIYRVCYVS